MISIIIGSESDRKIAEKATAILEEKGIKYDLQVISAHRNYKKLDEYLENSNSDVFIAIAGLSAALPGIIAAKTKRPVIGVPVDVKLGGLDALLSIVQMPKGVPVACVGIDNSQNAAWLAIRILGLKYPELMDKL
ncbi:MAG: 5-(carboxyamino)imidazole ribonucleotide mutase [Candidatus Helarchaeota archaeon]